MLNMALDRGGCGATVVEKVKTMVMDKSVYMESYIMHTAYLGVCLIKERFQKRWLLCINAIIESV